MFIQQFRYLVAVVEERHFARAARRCSVSQASLSNAIKLLEFELGVPIVLRRRGRGFQGLTPEGERVAAWSRAVLAYCDAMRKEVAMMQNQLTGYLRIGAMPTVSPILPFLLSRVRSEHPGIRIDVQFIGNDAMRRGLSDFSLDIAITYLETDDFGRKNMLPLFTDSFVLLVPDKPAFRHLDTITWKEAAQVPLSMLRSPMDERRCTDKVFRSVGCSPVAAVESESIMHLLFQTQFTELCTIIPSYYAHAPGLHGGTRALRLVDPTVTETVGLFWTEGEIALPMANVFVSIVRTLSKSGEFRRRIEGHYQLASNTM